MPVNGGTQKGNFVLADVKHFDLGIGGRFGLNKLINVGAELGTKVRDFKTVQSPQPSGAASEGYLRLDFSVAFGR